MSLTKTQKEERTCMNELGYKNDTRYGNILSFLLPFFQEGQLSVTGESMCKTTMQLQQQQKRQTEQLIFNKEHTHHRMRLFEVRSIFRMQFAMDGGFAILRPFQQYFSHIRTIGG